MGLGSHERLRRMGLGGIFMILFWVLVIAAIIAVVRWISGDAAGGPRQTSALDILNERYARGEIDEEEFQRKKKELLS